jgi:chromosome partitioning protein
LKPNVFHWLCEPEVRLEDVMHPTAIPKLVLVPSYKEMSQFPTVIGNDPRRTRRLSDGLQAADLSAFDLVIFDSPPSLGLTTMNILLASTEVIVPVALTYFALDGCAEMVETVQQVADEHGRSDLSISLVVPTLHRNTALAQEILEKLRSYFPGRLAKTSLGFNVKIDEAQSHGKTIWEYASSSRGAKMLAAIAEEVLAAPARLDRAAGQSAGSPAYVVADQRV